MPSKLRQVGYIVLSSLLVVSMAVAGLVINVGIGAGTPLTASATSYYGGVTGSGANPNVDDLGMLNITPGSDATQLCFSWATTNSLIVAASSATSPDSPIPTVEIAPMPAGWTTGSLFPSSGSKTFYGTSIQSYYSVAGNPSTSPTALSEGNFYQNKVTVSGLTPSTQYVYQVGDSNGTWSSPFTLTTQSTNSFSFIAVGDPQIGARDEVSNPGNTTQTYAMDQSIQADSSGWLNTVTQALTKCPGASFMVSMGDEVDNESDQNLADVPSTTGTSGGTEGGQDQEYDGYFVPQMTGLPVANIDGNHDYALGPYFGYHYDLPNQSTQYGATAYGNDGDYWFTYGNALFMVLNSNTQSIATHDVFMGQAIAANPNAKWRIVCYHHSIYSEANHYSDGDIQFRRANYPAVFDKYHIDVVLSGHDHSYTRTYQMLGGVAQTNQTTLNGSVVNPTGTVYFTLDSGSGSKFYDWNTQLGGVTGTPAYYSAYRWQMHVPTFSCVTIDGDNFSIVTYRTDNMSVIDKYSIAKS